MRCVLAAGHDGPHDFENDCALGEFQERCVETGTQVNGEWVVTTECDKMVEAREAGKTGIGGTLTDFYDFLKGRGVVLATWQQSADLTELTGGVVTEMLTASRYDGDPHRLFADFLCIDLDKAEEEKRAMLRALGNTSV